MARRRSKWRRTWQTLKKMMQEARKTRAYQSLRQCPMCGNPNSLSINIKVDKETDRKSAEVMCSACNFSYVFPEIPVIADEFWVYSRVLDMAQGSEAGLTKAVEESGAMAEEARGSGEGASEIVEEEKESEIEIEEEA